MKKVLGIFGIAILGGIVTLGGYKLLLEKPQVIIEEVKEPKMQAVNANYTPAILNSSSVPTDFTEAAEKTIHAVVHVKNTAVKMNVNNLSDLFYGRSSQRAQVGTGSGVIISPDGYIVSNNHVIANASDLEITLNNRKKYKAELIATDEKNDIALLKINADFDLPYIPFANSDNVKIGEWVLAVGNPYNLNSTVTAGIISAKGRDLEGNTNIEAFIQTDAAVNPGNSGGALVNTRGELVGINTAITSKTGSFIGYSFAVPSNIARKIVDDLLEFGNVQEALIGFVPEFKNADEIEGVKIASISEDSSAKLVGLKAGDVITKINEVQITKYSDLKGQLTAKRPGDLINVTVERNGEEILKQVKLSKKDYVVISRIGLTLKDLSKKDLSKFKIESGVIVLENRNRMLQRLGVQPGFIIAKINNEKVVDIIDAKNKLLAINNNQSFVIEVINLEGETIKYGF